MYISHETPLSILDKSRVYNDYDYALVHLFEKYEKYYDFFKESIALERDVLLDNSIFELGEAFDSNKFVSYINDLKPTFYVVPDVLENGYETIKSYMNFVQTNPDIPGIKIGTVQGKTYDELVDCYKFMSDNADYLAISFDYSYYVVTGIGKNKLERMCEGRHRFIRSLIKDGIWNWNKPHHLLGCSLAKEFKKYNDIKNIRSLDTSNPIVAGIKGFRYNSDLGLNHKPSVKLADLIEHEVTDSEWEIIQYNIFKFEDIALS